MAIDLDLGCIVRKSTRHHKRIFRETTQTNTGPKNQKALSQEYGRDTVKHEQKWKVYYTAGENSACESR